MSSKTLVRLTPEFLAHASQAEPVQLGRFLVENWWPDFSVSFTLAALGRLDPSAFRMTVADRMFDVITEPVVIPRETARAMVRGVAAAVVHARS